MCYGANLPGFQTLCNNSKKLFAVLFMFLVLQGRNICKDLLKERAKLGVILVWKMLSLCSVYLSVLWHDVF